MLLTHLETEFRFIGNEFTYFLKIIPFFFASLCNKCNKEGARGMLKFVYFFCNIFKMASPFFHGR